MTKTVKTSIFTLPVSIPNIPENKKVIKEANRQADILYGLFKEGFRVKFFTSTESRGTIYNSYVLEKEE